jgi:hypothetical protein
MTDAQELELIHLRNVIGLAAFAVEARRVLREIDGAKALLEQAGKPACGLLALVREHGQWLECPDTTAQVLSDVHDRLDALLSHLLDV